MAYHQFCKDLCQIGITEDIIIRRKEDEILEILRSQGMFASSQIGGNKAGDQGRILDQDWKLEKAYKEFYDNLYQLGVAEDMLPPKDDILRILRSRGVVASGSRNTEDKGQSVVPFLYMQLLTYK